VTRVRQFEGGKTIEPGLSFESRALSVEPAGVEPVAASQARPDLSHYRKQLTYHYRPPLLPELLPHSNRGASGHGPAPPGAEPSAAWAPPYPLGQPGPRRAVGSATTLIRPRPPASPPFTAAAVPPPRPSTPSFSTTSRASWPGPPRPTHRARAWRAGSRRTSAPTCAAASWPMTSHESGATTAPPGASWPSPAPGAGG
jgi:hypothetical protein